MPRQFKQNENDFYFLTTVSLPMHRDCSGIKKIKEDNNNLILKSPQISQ